ncbi:MAG TPA: hypothetical protein VNZ49_15100 [Bacteroidia bacterium]|jgi:hypothetical protein|nr:hypothetical protein [Bacteroidia bacterium]
MKKITSTQELKEAIAELEIKRSNAGAALKGELIKIKESLRPLNLLKNTFQDVTSASSIKENILTNIIGLAAGYLAKKAVFGKTRNPVKKLAGTLLQMGIAGSASRIKSIGAGLMKRFFNRPEEKKIILDNVDQM